jgi:hypothetical protein
MKFLKIEIIAGIQMLIALRLKNSPASDMAIPHAKIWYYAFESYPVAWDEELDKDRIQRMFTICSANCNEFPSPLQAYQMLPAREKRLSLPKPQTNKMSAENRKLLDDLLAKLNRKMVR